jgi:hypothetical protein
VTCQRGHTEHATRWVTINLGGPTGFGDYCAIPQRFARTFDMLIYERDETPGPLCPANDAVSEMLGVHGMWEPQGTALALSVMESDAPGEMHDFGAHVGWYSLLAMSCGRWAFAWEPDAESAGMLRQSAIKNGWNSSTIYDVTVGPDSTVQSLHLPIRFLKIDIEGAEADAVRIMWPAISNGKVDHILMEVSPCFGPGYPELVEKLRRAGYRVYALPPKQYPPVELDDPERALDRLDTRPDMAEIIGGCGQMDVWFRREGASW